MNNVRTMETLFTIPRKEMNPFNNLIKSKLLQECAISTNSDFQISAMQLLDCFSLQREWVKTDETIFSYLDKAMGNYDALNHEKSFLWNDEQVKILERKVAILDKVARIIAFFIHSAAKRWTLLGELHQDIHEDNLQIRLQERWIHIVNLFKKHCLWIEPKKVEKDWTWSTKKWGTFKLHPAWFSDWFYNVTETDMKTIMFSINRFFNKFQEKRRHLKQVLKSKKSIWVLLDNTHSSLDTYLDIPSL